ncbi:siderophore-interacting protein [Actinoplanes sp. TBRC 11911]|uniref:siderophore-interacting protein n=1 Tax=Actinoplanes sp. TBRC 11911 TaxID=2729386 RepID=UPI00145EE21E|nr:siderophore-interacting protein [Actinoplanes sp. TBRC 11911]NMO56187.1 siderophore-interacting protein [Actinoplanes sp. TBRC 11911]
MAEAWRFFTTEVRAVRGLSPHFVRVTFTGEDLDRFADNGFDQRIKLILPLADGGFEHLPTHADWYEEWRSLPDHRRNPVRTYTVRAVRPRQKEVDLDMVLHGATGPASRWAVEVSPGAPARLMGPNADFDGVHGGIDFRPPALTANPQAFTPSRRTPDPRALTLDPPDLAAAADTGSTPHLLIAGDETAVPAIASILGCLPPYARGESLIEIPSPDDIQDLTAPPGVPVTWLPRNGNPHGERLITEVRRRFGKSAKPTDIEDVDVDTDTLWEVPEPVTGHFYAWLAGEAGVIKTLRRYLVGECGVDRGSVAFMGYWRLGRPEDI